MRRLFSIFTLVVGVLGAQVFPSSITLGANAPSGVTSVSTTRVGNKGNSTYYYWVIANYNIGSGQFSPYSLVLGGPDSLSSSNYIQVQWTPTSGVLNYDILRTTTPYIPVPCTCAVVTGLSTVFNTWNDQSNSLSSYTYVQAPNATATFTLDNSNYTAARVNLDKALNLPLLGQFTIAGLPSATLNDGRVAVVTNGASTSDCTVGSGSSWALCIAKSGVWTALGGSGGGGISGLTPNVIPKALTPTTIGDSSITDDGTTVSTPEGIATGSTPPSVTAGTGGVWGFHEGTSPSVCAASGVDCLYSDSASHSLKVSNNNGSFYSIPQLVGTGTATLRTSTISSATCATVVTVAATGVVSTDSIFWNPNASIKAVTGYTPTTSGGLSIAAYPTANNVNFDVCNWTSGSITPGAVTLNFTVVGIR